MLKKIKIKIKNIFIFNCQFTDYFELYYDKTQSEFIFLSDAAGTYYILPSYWSGCLDTDSCEHKKKFF